MTSCYSSQTIKVNGNPGTQIYSPGWSYIGTIPNSGELKIKINDDSYFPFMLSLAQNDDKIIPFGIDYTHKNRPWASVANGAGLTIATAGLIGTVAGTIGVACDSENETMGMFLGSSLAAAGLGVAIGMPGDCRRKQTAYKYKYKYLASQHTNENIHFSRPDIKYVEPVVMNNTSEKINRKSTDSNISSTIENWYENYAEFNEIYEICITNLKTKREATIQNPEGAVIFNGDEGFGANGVRLKYWHNDKLYETEFIKTKQFTKTGKVIKALEQENDKEFVIFTILSDNKFQLEFKDGDIKYFVKFNPKSIKIINLDDLLEDTVIDEMDDEPSWLDVLFGI